MVLLHQKVILIFHWSLERFQKVSICLVSVAFEVELSTAIQEIAIFWQAVYQLSSGQSATVM